MRLGSILVLALLPVLQPRGPSQLQEIGSSQDVLWLEEMELTLNPKSPDSDGDGLRDG